MCLPPPKKTAQNKIPKNYFSQFQFCQNKKKIDLTISKKSTPFKKNPLEKIQIFSSQNQFYQNEREKITSPPKSSILGGQQAWAMGKWAPPLANAIFPIITICNNECEVQEVNLLGQHFYRKQVVRILFAPFGLNITAEVDINIWLDAFLI